jgi:hypothetical protein
MPAAALAAVTTVGPAGAAAAKAKVYTTTSCAITGGVTFATPGLSYNGSLTKKSTSTSVSSATAGAILSGTGGCGSATVASKIVSASTNCNTATPPLPGACSSETTKEFYAYDNASSLVSSGTSSIVSSLGPKGLKLNDNGNKVTVDITEAGTSSVLPGGDCGANVGFELSGNTSVAGLTYDLLLCITGDTGTGTTGSFYNDYVAAASGNAGITIASGIFGGDTALSFTYTA